MKKVLTIALLLYTFLVQAQDSTYVRNDSLFTRSGYIIIAGQDLKIGSGSAPDGDFKYISISQTSLMYGTSDNRSMANGYNSLSRQNAHHAFKVVRIDERGNKKHGFYYYPIINVGATRFQVDIDDAIASGEIVIPVEFKKQQTAAAVPQEDVYDKLTKLKKLLDDSAITQQEYDAQKKKLLGEQ